MRSQSSSIVNSPHNLSASGPGTIRAATRAGGLHLLPHPPQRPPVQPLWNRNMPAAAYTLYSSNSLQAKPGQPTGSSKLCLSCHDGTIALGSVLSRDQPIAMAGGMTTLPPGHVQPGHRPVGRPPDLVPLRRQPRHARPQDPTRRRRCRRHSGSTTTRSCSARRCHDAAQQHVRQVPGDGQPQLAALQVVPPAAGAPTSPPTTSARPATSRTPRRARRTC